MIEVIVKKSPAVFIFAFMIVILGFVSYFSLPRENFPEIKRPMIFVNTIYPGVSAEEMESLITKEIEREIDGLEGLDQIYSTSAQGISSVTAEFTGDTKVEDALRRVKERVDIAKIEIPQDAEEPMVKELNFSDMPIIILALTNPAGLEILERTADRLEEEIKKVPGVMDVIISGKLEKEVSIELDPVLLRHYGFSLNDVSQGIRKEHVTIPGGVLKGGAREYSLSVSGEIKDAREFEEIVIHKDGKKVKLRDIGKVTFAYKEPDTISRVNGKPSISLSIKKRGGENILSLSEKVKEIVKSMKPKMPNNTEYFYTLDTSKNVVDMVYDLENNILSGLLLVILITLFFLGPLNATFVSMGIPFSMLMTFFCLQVFGITLNMVVLFSLTLALGMLVDNGIVLVENIYRHRSLGKDRRQSAIDGCREIAIPISTSTLTTILAFFPIIYMPGIMGEFMQFLPKTVIIVLVASLIVAISITTVFCAKFLKYNEKSAKSMEGGDDLFGRIQKKYVYILIKSLNKPKRYLAVSFFLVFAGIILQAVGGAGTIFFPKMDPEAASISVKLPSGSTLEQTDLVHRQIEGIIPSIPNSLENTQTTVGRPASGGKGPSGGGGGLESSQGSIRLGFIDFLHRKIPSNDYLEQLGKLLAKIPGAEVKIAAQEGGPPSGHDISYEVTGVDYEIIGDLSEKIYAIIEKYRDQWEAYESEFEAKKPELKIEVDREKAAHYGLDTQLIASTIRTAISGQKVAKYRVGKDEYDIRLRLDEDFRTRISSLKDLEIVSKESRIFLSSVAKIYNSSTIKTIKHRDRKRAISIWADFRSKIRERMGIKKAIEEEVRKIEVPRGYSIGSGVGQDVRQESTVFLIQAFAAAIMLIFLVLVMQFNSVTQPIIILISVFLSLGGVFWGYFLFHQTFVIIMSGMGVISLAGVVVNNAIVLIEFINQLVDEGQDIKSAVIEGGSTRFRPVILTALTTVIGLLPMALGVSFDFHTFTPQFASQSASFWSPMAWTVIFGLTFATVLTLIVVPILVYLNHKIFHKANKIKKA